MLTASDYRPAAWLRNGHMQSLLSAALLVPEARNERQTRLSDVT